MPGDIIIFRSVPKIMIICYTGLEIWRETRNYYFICYNVPEISPVTNAIAFFHFGLFCALFTLVTAQKIKISKKKKKKKNEKNPAGLSFYTCVPKIMIRWCMVPEMWGTMDRQIDGQMEGKNDILRWVPNLKDNVNI